MKRTATTCLAAAMLLAAMAAPAAAQADGPPADLDVRFESIDVVDHPTVNLTVTIRGLAGSGLGDPLLTVTEQGEPVAAQVTRAPTEGMELVLLVDTSGSMRGAPLARAQVAATEFVAQLPPAVEVAVVAFGETSTVVGEFSRDRTVSTEAIETLISRGETALYDGLVTATALFAERLGLDRPAPRRAVVLLSDGGDTVSSIRLDDAILALLGSGAQFYAVELLSSENDHEALARLEEATGGTLVAADDPEALAGIFSEIAASIVNRFDITYESPNSGPTRVTVTAAAGGHAGSVVRSLRYPNAPPAPPPPPPPPPEPAPVVTAPPPPAPVEAPPPPAPVAPQPIDLGSASGSLHLTLGLAAIFTAMLALGVLAGRGSHRARAAAADVRKMLKTRERTKLSKLTEKVSDFAEHGLERRGRKNQLELALESAGSRLRSGEFVIMVGSGALAGYAAGLLLGATAAGVLLAAVGAIAPWLWLSRAGTKRRALFAEQLLGTLQLMSGSLRAGFGLLQSLDVVAEEAPAPTSDEFRRVKLEVQLGRDLDDALDAMASRVGGEDFEWVVEGIRIHRDVGGDLAEILEGVSETVRERAKLFRQIKALSAEGRFSAGFLVALPVIMVALLSVTNPDYLGELTGSTIGRLLAAGGLVLISLGALWMRRIIKIEL